MVVKSEDCLFSFFFFFIDWQLCLAPGNQIELLKIIFA